MFTVCAYSSEDICVSFRAYHQHRDCRYKRKKKQTFNPGSPET